MDPSSAQQALIDRARRGDRAAFDELAAGCRERLARVVRFRLGPSLRRVLDVEDVLQETYLRGFGAIARFTWRHEGSFFEWLSGIARNVIREACARSPGSGGEPGEAEEEPPAPGASPSRELRRGERLERLQKALDELPPAYRQVLRGALVEKLPLVEIARRLGKTPNAVSLLLLRANRKLRESFGETQSLCLPPEGLDWGESHDDA
jgi:RNA polymerase sigma-70 factor (ECF subfamily)